MQPNRTSSRHGSVIPSPPYVAAVSHDNPAGKELLLDRPANGVLTAFRPLAR